jgi:D-3-phosphoglycerate dehydrogenase
MQQKFRIGITRDALRASGEPIFDRLALGVLDSAPEVSWEFIPESVTELSAEHGARYDALCVMAPKVTAATLSHPECRVKIVARHGVGFDNVDLDACSAKGVLVTITPNAVRRPVATSVIAYMLALAHKIPTKDRLTRSGRWGERLEHMGVGLIGKTLGVIGAGNIGQEVFRMAMPFDLRFIAAEPQPDRAELDRLGVSLVDLDTLLREADFISVNCPLNEKTRHLIGAREFGLMKPSAFFINTARGPVVDEPALIETLRNSRIAGAGIDVFEQEPAAAENPLFALDNVIVMPHAICWTDECFRMLAEDAFRSVLARLRGKRPQHIVNRKALDHPSLAGLTD